jgi:hypothetical protein
MQETLYHLVIMEQWSGAQRAFAVKAYYKNDDSEEAARQELRHHFNLARHAQVPFAHAVTTWACKFKESGPTLNKTLRG